MHLISNTWISSPVITKLTVCILWSRSQCILNNQFLFMRLIDLAHLIWFDLFVFPSLRAVPRRVILMSLRRYSWQFTATTLMNLILLCQINWMHYIYTLWRDVKLITVLKIAEILYISLVGGFASPIHFHFCLKICLSLIKKPNPFSSHPTSGSLTSLIFFVSFILSKHLFSFPRPFIFPFNPCSSLPCCLLHSPDIPAYLSRTICR